MGYLIQFSGPSHEGWFIFSIILFLFALLSSFCEKKGHLFICLSIYFFIMSFFAFIVIIVLKQPNSATGFSFDCIWFNASMGLLCILFSYFTKFLFSYLQKRKDERDRVLVELS